jgi:hypothetical protein
MDFDRKIRVEAFDEAGDTTVSHFSAEASFSAAGVIIEAVDRYFFFQVFSRILKATHAFSPLFFSSSHLLLQECCKGKIEMLSVLSGLLATMLGLTVLIIFVQLMVHPAKVSVCSTILLLERHMLETCIVIKVFSLPLNSHEVF